MISAVVLINTDIGLQDKVLESLRLVEGVEEAHALCGVYDLIVKVKANSIDKLKEILKLSIKQIAGVASSLPLMLIDNPLKT